tara:strand:+ start:64 stop:252 length:189 start_codon:yes stop_codon:yes gene_type:complete
MVNGFYDLMDMAMASAVGVTIDTWVDVIENKCTYEEAEFIVDNIWQEDGDTEAAKQLFESKL